MTGNPHTRPNPWVGLSSYADPATTRIARKFCGRDRSTSDVVHLIDDNLVVTLYGRSGIGKTSLLNAGVFPALRREQYLPLSLRLGLTQGAETFQKRIINAVENTARDSQCTIRTLNVLSTPEAEDTEYRSSGLSDEDFLWRYFASHRFIGDKGQVVFPVIVLDQFEEVYRERQKRVQADILLAQLHYMADETHVIDDCIVDGEEYSYDFNFRFVLSIREDDLFRLEDSIDNGGLNLLKTCRYRLRGFLESDAHDIIRIPGEGLFPPNEEEAKEIRDRIIEIVSGDERHQRINPNVFSLVCSRLFINFQQHPEEPYITLKMVDDFRSTNFFVSFYRQATSALSAEEQAFIENRFVDSASKRRVPVPEDLLRERVHSWQQLLEGDNRIMQHAPVSTEDEVRFVELLHDSFCQPLMEMRRRRTWINRLIDLLLAVLFLVLVTIATSLFYDLYSSPDVQSISQYRSKDSYASGIATNLKSQRSLKEELQSNGIDEHEDYYADDFYANDSIHHAQEAYHEGQLYKSEGEAPIHRLGRKDDSNADFKTTD